LEFEVSRLVPASLIDEDVLQARMQTRPLHLEQEIEHFGGETIGGLGISIPLGVEA
jgi:hypothetical protein